MSAGKDRKSAGDRERGSDALGNRDPSPGASPGYDEQQAPDAATAKRPGARRPPTNEDGGVERDVDSKSVAGKDDASGPGRKSASRPKKSRTPE